MKDHDCSEYSTESMIALRRAWAVLFADAKTDDERHEASEWVACFTCELERREEAPGATSRIEGHTPEPWQTDGRTVMGTELVNAGMPRRGAEIIATVNHRANAPVITAAPTLYAELQRVAAELEEWLEGDDFKFIDLPGPLLSAMRARLLAVRDIIETAK